ncbi:imidazolonepropionase [Aureimonas frigidaquae]|uniref:Imidazolonepropionase n=1 Tax=Aureimonas frigidaquae TaxID=424757 RepID=A0A0P0Z0X4_9HYPH|nr:imidazolonepropionase [Aureimonas frigidaquae]BAT27532.1 imidazolonepropionase [Aureimonas frigidaquae]
MDPRLLTDMTLCTMAGDRPYGLVPDGAVVIEDGLIAYAGPRAGLPERWSAVPARSLQGRLVTPALIDCHTHLVFGGDRAREFEMRLTGHSYEEIARAGGGIAATVAATRALHEDALVAAARPRLDALRREGVATVEIKSGYGLSVSSELTMLRAARRLGREAGIRVRTSYLAAHSVPPEYRGRADAYLSQVVLPGMEHGAAEGLIDAVDAFCEGIAFSVAEVERVFDAAQALGLPIKLHAEQLSNLNGAAMAARRGALSADHLEHLDADGVAAMARSGTVAVLLPGAYYALRETKAPPVAALRDAGVPMALATDCNPGTSPMSSLLLAMNMGATLFRLTPEEALAGVTRHAARALGLADTIGTLEPGKRAELAVFSVSHPAELAYRIGFNPHHETILGHRP